MGRADWTPIVLITSTVSLTVVTVVLLTSPVFHTPRDLMPGPARPRHALPDRVAVWVGEVDGGVTAMLAPVWGDDEPDRLHDGTLRAGLGLPESSALAFYDLYLFNTTDEPRTVSLPDGALRIRPSGLHVAPVPLRSVVELVDRGEAAPSPALRTVLLGRGMLRPTVTINARSMANVLVAFERRVDLGAAEGVSAADGGAFRRRPMARRELEALVLEPTERRIEDL